MNFAGMDWESFIFYFVSAIVTLLFFLRVFKVIKWNWWIVSVPFAIVVIFWLVAIGMFCALVI